MGYFNLLYPLSAKISIEKHKKILIFCTIFTKYTYQGVIMEIIFAKRLKELMIENNLNQVQLAEKANLKQNTISSWLKGKKLQNITSLWLLADVFSVEIDYLIGRKDY